MRTGRILVVDDVPLNVDILVELLDEYDISVALDGKSALEIVSQEPIDLVLLDIRMPEMDGFEVCREIKQMEEKRDIPILFITAESDESSIIRGFEEGGVDFVTKPFLPQELRARVRTHLSLRENIKKLEFLATRDSMTGALNRRALFERGMKMLDGANSEYSPFSAMMLDLDRFKNINDTLGHGVGDSVIKRFASIVCEHMDNSSIFGRVGGEEFVVFDNKEIDELTEVAKRIRERVESVCEIDGLPINFTVSIGLSTKLDHDENNIDAILKRADDMLYEAKKSRNRVVRG